MPENIHTINRELFEFNCISTEHAFQIRNRFNDDLHEKLNRIIDRACNEIDNDQAVITIPSLEIDLGTIYFDRFEEEVVWSFRKIFFEKLSGFKNSYRRSAGIELSKKEWSFDILKYFLRTGHLPWFAGKQDETYLENLFTEILNVEQHAFQDFILSNLNNDNFVERLTEQIGPDHFNRIIAILGLDADSFKAIHQIFDNIISKLISFLKTESNWLHSIYTDLIGQNRKDFQREISNALSVLENFENPDYHSFRPTLEFILKLLARKNDISSAEKVRKLFEKFLADKIGDIPTILNSFLVAQDETVQNLQTEVNAFKIQLQENKLIRPDEKSQTAEAIQQIKFYISNAGLILLANYLPAFFDQLKLLEGGEFVSKTNQIKALFLLHYLCSSKEEVSEYIVPLNKILCGLSLDEPIPQYFLLNEEERQECTELLKAVIENWQRVGNMSIDGFQEAFINRDGILSSENNQWTLRVERRGYDILLDSLPWSFSYTQLSWMQELIITEW